MNIKEIGRFITGGHAVFSFTNKKTGKRFVYKVVKHKNFDSGRRVWNVLLRCTVDGESAFGYIGLIEKRQFRHTPASMVDDETDEFSEFELLFLRVIRGKELPKNRLFEHTGRCGRCGRLLIKPESVERGLGSKCAEAV